MISQQTTAQVGSLQQIRDDVRRPDPPRSETPRPLPPPEREHDHHHHSHGDSYDDCDYDDDDCDDFETTLTLLALGAIGLGVTSPWWGPHVLVNDSFKRPGYFQPYPYADGLGRMEISPYEPANYRWWSARVSGQWGGDLDNQQFVGGHVLVETKNRWGFDTEWNHHYENIAGGMNDELSTGDFNVLFRFAQSERIQMYTGLGVNWLDDDIGTDFGFNFTYGGDFFIHDPWVISASIDWGTLGSAHLFHGRATIGIVMHRFEVYTGYDYYDVGETNLGSWIAGVRIWF
jgi:hypothetical protein